MKVSMGVFDVLGEDGSWLFCFLHGIFLNYSI